MPSSDLLQSILVVVGFLIGVFVLSNFLKRNLTQRKISNLGMNFKIISRLPLSSKASLFIVQIGNNYLLIGVSEQNISAIADLTKIFQSQSLYRKNLPNQFENSSSPSQDSNEPQLTFTNFLKETFRRSKN